ncbi:MAG: pentapeptide repeat-containing protein [Oscillatoriales cyanobacterium]|nr:MAG: pentapeptide repeat-containing protein [Oscillatoriales cyanobacterium]
MPLLEKDDHSRWPQSSANAKKTESNLIAISGFTPAILTQLPSLGLFRDVLAMPAIHRPRLTQALAPTPLRWNVVGAIAALTLGSWVTPAQASDLNQTTFNRRGLVQSNQCPGCNLQGNDLNGLDLRGANLRGANLRETLIIRANLRGADLTGADLRGAYLWGTDLTGTRLDGANLCGAIVPSGARSDVGCSSFSTTDFRPPVPSSDNSTTQVVALNAAGTAGLAKGTVYPNRSDVWLVNARPGKMQVLISSMSSNARFSVLGPDGATLATNTGEAFVDIPSEGQYQVVISSLRGPEAYELSVEIMPAGNSSSGVGDVNSWEYSTSGPRVAPYQANPAASTDTYALSVDPLSRYGTAQGSISSGEQDIWQVDLPSGQVEIRVDSNNDRARFDLTSQDGRVLARQVRKTKFRAPEDARYDISVGSTGGFSNYRLWVSFDR